MLDINAIERESPRAILLTLADGRQIDVWCVNYHAAQNFLAWIPFAQKAGEPRALRIRRATIQPARITLG